MITIRDYVEGKADLALGAFGVPITQKATKKAQEEQDKWRALEVKKEE
jgi:hypothetical protein